MNAMWNSINATLVKAKQTQALKSIKTQAKVLKAPGNLCVSFVLRVSENLKDKPKPTENGSGVKREFWDPFASENLERDLFISKLSNTHSLILNKFNVVDHHLLLITNEFQSQNDPVNVLDYQHLFGILNCFPQDKRALAFYNCGPFSGKSQPHKHVQIVPMPIAEDIGTFPFHVPIEECLRNKPAGQMCEIESLPYKAFICGINENMRSNEQNLKVLEDSVSVVRNQMDVLYDIPNEQWSYNLLLTLNWLLIVPRSRESYGPININSMGFAGTFLLRSEDELLFMEKQDPLKILTEVAYQAK